MAVAETRRALEHLRNRIEDSDIPRQELERDLFFSRGYLSQLLSGYIELKYWHVTAILEGLGVGPGDFLAELYPARLPPSRGGAELKVDRQVVEVYSFGFEALRELRDRILDCERQLVALRDSGELERLIAAAAETPEQP